MEVSQRKSMNVLNILPWNHKSTLELQFDLLKCFIQFLNVQHQKIIIILKE